jgi:hypothetical protein
MPKVQQFSKPIRQWFSCLHISCPQQDELDAKEEVGRYVCKAPHCIKQYDAFDIPDILQFDGSLQCAMCGGVVEQVFATGQTGDDEQRKQRREVRLISPFITCCTASSRRTSIHHPV